MKICTANSDAVFPDNEINYCVALENPINEWETDLLLYPFDVRNKNGLCVLIHF